MICPYCGKEISFGLVPVRERRSKLNYFPCEIKTEEEWYELQYDQKDLKKEVYREPRCPECDNYLFKNIYSIDKKTGLVRYGTKEIDEKAFLTLLQRACRDYYETKDKSTFWDFVTNLTYLFLDYKMEGTMQSIEGDWDEDQFLETLFKGISKLLTDCISASSLSLFFVATENKYTFITDLASIFGAYIQVLEERSDKEDKKRK